MEAARCTVKVSGRDLRSSSARPLERASLACADDLVLETLEEKLPAAARAKRLVAVVPNGCLSAANVVVGGAKLLNGRPARARGDEHLAEAVTAEIAVELSSKSHLSRNLHRENGEDRSFVPYTFDRPIRFPYP
jgi:hypothetical protein